MSKVFNSDYANQYDSLYGDKDYETECDLIEAAFERFANGKPGSLLDLGCGTGNHSIPLALRGYDVTGVDLSEDMLALANEKKNRLSNGGRINFEQGDVRNYKSERQFDAILMMFAVLGYQLENKDVLQTLNTVRQHLKPAGLFIFDVWYGPAVLSIRPSDRLKVIETEDGQLIRSASGTLDTYKHLSEVNYHVWRIRDKQVVSETQETHAMRYFFAQELVQFLEQAGMRLMSLTAFPSFQLPVSENTWNILGVAARVSL